MERDFFYPVEKLSLFRQGCSALAEHGRPKVPVRKLYPSRGIKTEAHVLGCSPLIFLRIEAYGLMRLHGKHCFMRAAARGAEGGSAAAVLFIRRLRAQCSAGRGHVKITLNIYLSRCQRNRENTPKFMRFDVEIAAHRSV